METVGEKESLREAAGRVNTMTAAFCVDCGLKLTGRYCGKCGRDYGASAAMQEPGDDDDNNEEDEEGVEKEGLASSSDDDADGIVEMVVRGKRMRTRNPRVFNDDFLRPAPQHFGCLIQSKHTVGGQNAPATRNTPCV